MQHGFERPANLVHSRNGIVPDARYDLVTAGNANAARGPAAAQFQGLRALLADSASRDLGNPPDSSFNVVVLADLVYLGDGGLFTERIVTPMFQALAYEVAKKGAAGCEPALRITYDDANESFVLPKNVQDILSRLGVQCASPLPLYC